MKNFYKTVIITLVSILGILIFQGCTKSPQVVHEEELHVDVMYLDRKMLPPNAKVTLLLEDISKQDVKSKFIAKQSIVVKNAPPYSFTIKYDFNSIDMKVPSVEYNSASSDFLNTYWKLMKIDSKSIKVAKNMKEPYIFFENDGKSVKGFGGCNAMFGTFKQNGQAIKIGPLASTRKACINGMDIEAEFHDILSKTKKWYIQGEVLKFTDAHGKNLAEFKAIYF